MSLRFSIAKLTWLAVATTSTAMPLGSCMTSDRSLEPTTVEPATAPRYQKSMNPSPATSVSIASPVARIGACLGAKVADHLFLFAAPCLFAGATHKLHMDFVSGTKTTLHTSGGLAYRITIVYTAPLKGFDPVVSRDELRYLANPRAIFGKSPRLDQDLVAHLDLKDRDQPQMVNLAVVKILEKTRDIPTALLLPGPHDPVQMVTVSGFRCQHAGSTHSLASDKIPPDHREWGATDTVTNDPARMLSPLNTLVLVDGAEAAFPSVPTVEPLCLGQNGSPIMTMTSRGYRLLGLGFARIRGILVGARVDGPMYPRILDAVNIANSITPSLQSGTAMSLSCTQVSSLLADASSREYQFNSLTFSLRDDDTIIGADDGFVLKVDPHDRPHFKVTLNLVDYCTAQRNLCYVGIYRDPVNGGVQVFKLEIQGTTPSLAHWVSAEGGAKTTPFESTSCTITPGPERRP